MFEDLLGPDKPVGIIFVPFITGGSPDQVCPLCGSTDIESTYGGFTSATSYFSTMFCVYCSGIWTIEYDNDLNIVNVKI